MLNFINVSKIYNKTGNDKFYALKNFSFNFDKKGMYAILGKSGSGKSTLANLGALLDTPSEGVIKYSGQDISKFKEKEANNYRAKIVTTIFQHYNLLNHLSVIENIIVPRLALQEDEKIARKDGMDLLKELGFAEEFGQKQCKNLSGGEAQRVAIIRAVINNPEILIADEPTGALDETNSILIMELLKRIAKNKIVIVITHNEKLAKQFADEILYIKDGELEKTEVRKIRPQSKLVKIKPDKKLGKHNKWLYRFAIKRLNKNKGKNILSCFSTVFGLVSVFLIIGFSFGSNLLIETKSKERFDYGVGEISKTEIIKIDGSMLNLTKMARLKDYELYNLGNKYPFLTFGLNFDALFDKSSFKVNNIELNGVSFEFIYEFSDDYCNKDLLSQGDLLKNGGIIINEPCLKLIKDKTNLPTILGRNIEVSSNYEINNVIKDKNIIDEFRFKKSYSISGVSKEFSFLATPKIYLPYKQIKEQLQMELINNLSQQKDMEITWYEYIKTSSDTDEITSFSHKVFSKSESINDYEALLDSLKDNETLSIDCQPYILKTTFISLIDSVKMGLTIFCILAIIGTVLIIGINAFSSYTFERKNSAIYFAFGVSRQQVFTIFIIESIIITLFAFILSVIFSFGLEKLINLAIYNFFDIENLILIPFYKFKNIPYFLITIGLVSSLFTCILCTYLPLTFAKKINIKKELSDE